MAVTTVDAIRRFAGNGVTTTFNAPDVQGVAENLRVTLFDAAGAGALQVLNTDFTFNAGTGQITTVTFTPQVGEVLVIARDTPLLQPRVFAPLTELPAATIESSLDDLTRIVQDLDARLDRAVLVSAALEDPEVLDGLLGNINALAPIAADISAAAAVSADISAAPATAATATAAAAAASADAATASAGAATASAAAVSADAAAAAAAAAAASVTVSANPYFAVDAESLASRGTIKTFVEANSARGWTYSPVQALTGVRLHFTWLPLNAAEVELLLFEASLSGSDNYRIQLLTASGAIASGYTSHSLTSGRSNATSASGFVIRAASANRIITGVANFLPFSPDIWLGWHRTRESIENFTNDGSGSVTGVTEPIIGLRLEPTGTNTFDNGSALMRWRE